MLENKEHDLIRKVGTSRKRYASSQCREVTMYRMKYPKYSESSLQSKTNLPKNQSHISVDTETDKSVKSCRRSGKPFSTSPKTKSAETTSVWFTSSFKNEKSRTINLKNKNDNEISSKQIDVDNGSCYKSVNRNTVDSENGSLSKWESAQSQNTLHNLKTSTPMKVQVSATPQNIDILIDNTPLDSSDTLMADIDLTQLSEENTTKQYSPAKTEEKKEIQMIDSEEDLFEESFQNDDFLTHLDRIEINENVDQNLNSVKNCTDGVSSESHGIGSKTTNKKSASEEKHGNVYKSWNTNNSSNCNTVTCNNIPDTIQIIEVKTTPILSLRDKIKRKLHANAGTKNMQSPGHLMADLRREIIEKAQTEAEIIQNKGIEGDLGPFYGLPSKVHQLFKTQRGIEKLYDWQDECLQLPAVMEGKNLIYCLPTSGGKTLVAEILILQQLLCKKKDALLVLPFVSIVQEKVRIISQLAAELDFLVEEYAGSKGRFPPIKRRQKTSLFIATIEKAHSLINNLVEQGRIESLGLVVIDELHMIGEGGSRGAGLESLLLKVLHADKSTQIIGMSATLSNVGDIQQFLHAEVFSNDFRPVKLTEYVKLEDNIYELQTKTDVQLEHSRVVTYEYTPDMTRSDPDHLLGLVLEVIPDKSCLIFCPTKKNCENVAMMLCKLMVKHTRELSMVKKSERKALLQELYSDGNSKICPVLQYTVHFGVAYHHSGLTSDERRLIEDAYADGVLCLLTCTSTLAAGVNLPAKRVILRCPYVAANFISRSQYKQMVGRAGRAGIDTSGESILITNIRDKEKVLELLTGPMGKCHSSLNHDDGKGIRGLILSTIGLEITKTTEDVFSLLMKTLLYVQSSQLGCDMRELAKHSLQKLLDMGLVVQKRASSQESVGFCVEVTSLGKATFKGSIDIDVASKLYKDLKKAEESLVLASHLHLLYLVTPYDAVNGIQPPWMTYFQQMSTLNAVELKVAELIGVSESYVAKKASGQATRQVVDDMVIKRFYLTLMLYDLWKQKSIWEVSEKFNQPRGFIQNLLSSAASFAACVFHFCQELEEFWAFQDLLGNFVKRLSYCVSAELIPLMEIPGIKLGRAKQLYNAGLKTLSHVANADPQSILKLVKQISRKAATQIVASAKVLLNEKAEALREEVEELVALPV